jgi:hypothetical protein
MLERVCEAGWPLGTGREEHCDVLGIGLGWHVLWRFLPARGRWCVVGGRAGGCFCECAVCPFDDPPHRAKWNGSDLNEYTCRFYSLETI